eukprot:2709762-Rhodomonas_salina.1
MSSTVRSSLRLTQPSLPGPGAASAAIAVANTPAFVAGVKKMVDKCATVPEVRRHDHTSRLIEHATQTQTRSSPTRTGIVRPPRVESPTARPFLRPSH